MISSAWESLLRLIQGLLQTPDGFKDNPIGYAGNQAYHFCIGLFCVLIMPWWLVIALYAIWEAVQIFHYKAGVLDSLEDYAYVAAGVFFPASAIPIFALMVYGVYRRV